MSTRREHKRTQVCTGDHTGNHGGATPSPPSHPSTDVLHLLLPGRGTETCTDRQDRLGGGRKTMLKEGEKKEDEDVMMSDGGVVGDDEGNTGIKAEQLPEELLVLNEGIC